MTDSNLRTSQVPLKLIVSKLGSPCSSSSIQKALRLSTSPLHLNCFFLDKKLRFSDIFNNVQASVCCTTFADDVSSVKHLTEALQHSNCKLTSLELGGKNILFQLFIFLNRPKRTRPQCYVGLPTFCWLSHYPYLLMNLHQMCIVYVLWWRHALKSI